MTYSRYSYKRKVRWYTNAAPVDALFIPASADATVFVGSNPFGDVSFNTPATYKPGHPGQLFHHRKRIIKSPPPLETWGEVIGFGDDMQPWNNPNPRICVCSTGTAQGDSTAIGKSTEEIYDCCHGPATLTIQLISKSGCEDIAGSYILTWVEEHEAYEHIVEVGEPGGPFSIAITCLSTLFDFPLGSWQLDITCGEISDGTFGLVTSCDPWLLDFGSFPYSACCIGTVSAIAYDSSKIHPVIAIATAEGDSTADGSSVESGSVGTASGDSSASGVYALDYLATAVGDSDASAVSAMFILQSSTGTAEGTSDAAAVSALFNISTAAAAASSTAAAVGAMFVRSSSTAAASSTAVAVSSMFVRSTSTAAASSTAVAVSSMFVRSTSTAVGTSASSAVGAKFNLSSGTSTATSTADGKGFEVIATKNLGSTDGNAVTTAAVTTSNATLIFVAVASFQGAVAPVFSDSKSNTWSLIPGQGNGANCRIQMYRCVNPTVGTGHTFTASGTGSLPAVAMVAFRGFSVAASPTFDSSSGAGSAGSTSLLAGPLGMTFSALLPQMVLGICSVQGAISGLTAGYTFSGTSVNYVASLTMGIGLCWKFSYNATENLTWSYSASVPSAVQLIAQEPI